MPREPRTGPQRPQKARPARTGRLPSPPGLLPALPAAGGAISARDGLGDRRWRPWVGQSALAAAAPPPVPIAPPAALPPVGLGRDRKSTRLNSSHLGISYAVFC